MAVNKKIKYMVMVVYIENGKRTPAQHIWHDRDLAIAEYKRIKELKNATHVKIFKCEEMFHES